MTETGRKTFAWDSRKRRKGNFDEHLLMNLTSCILIKPVPKLAILCLLGNILWSCKIAKLSYVLTRPLTYRVSQGQRCGHRVEDLSCIRVQTLSCSENMCLQVLLGMIQDLCTSIQPSAPIFHPSSPIPESHLWATPSRPTASYPKPNASSDPTNPCPPSLPQALHQNAIANLP